MADSITSFFKGFELATEELSESSLFTSRWLQAPLVLFEVGLACWLLGGLHVRATRWVLLITFLAFFETALFLAAAGYGSCHCLGRTTLSPWVAVGFDALAIIGIWFWQPAAGGPTLFSHRGRFTLVAGLFVLAAFPALASMISYTPTGRMPLLRNDPDLTAKVSVQLKNATPQQLLERLQAATGLSYSIDERLRDSWPSGLGEIKTSGTPAWALMEQLVHTQVEPTRWQRVDGGYHLARSAPMGARTPWLISGAALLVSAAYLLFSRGRARESGRGRAMPGMSGSRGEVS